MAVNISKYLFRGSFMGETQNIWIYGNSVILGTVRASFLRNGKYALTTVAFPLPQNIEEEATKPDAIIFDIDFPYPRDAFLLLESCPSLKLIGVSGDRNIVKVWSGHQLQEISTLDLMKIANSGSNKQAETLSNNENEPSLYQI
jgi:hypothetical protein